MKLIVGRSAMRSRAGHTAIVISCGLDGTGIGATGKDATEPTGITFTDSDKAMYYCGLAGP
jgi:hypothetical protein